MTDERTRRLLAARLAEEQASRRSGAPAFRFRRGGDGAWTGLDGYFAGNRCAPCTARTGT